MGPPSGGGRKASVSLQLFKETARAGEGEGATDGRRAAPRPSPGKSRHPSSSSSAKGKEREREHTITLPAGEGFLTFSSPLASPDATIFAPVASSPHSVSRSRNSSRAPSRLGQHSPAVSPHPLPTSPVRPIPLHATHSPHAPHPPPSLAQSLSTSFPLHQHPFPSGLSSSRPASPHLTPQHSHYSPRSVSTASPIPDLPASEGRGLGLGEPALPLPTAGFGAGLTTGRLPEQAVVEEEDEDANTPPLPRSLANEEPLDDDEALPPVSAGLKLLYSPRMSLDPSRHTTPHHSPPHATLERRRSDKLREPPVSTARAADKHVEPASAPAAPTSAPALAPPVAVPAALTIPPHGGTRVGFAERLEERQSRPISEAEEERSEYDSWTGSTSEYSSSVSDWTGDDYLTGEEGTGSGSDEDDDAGEGAHDAFDDAQEGGEQEYEVDMGALQDKLAQGGGGEVSMRRDMGRASDFKSRLVGGDGRTSATVPLEPFRHQVGGHNHIFRFSKKAVCKVRRPLLLSPPSSGK